MAQACYDTVSAVNIPTVSLQCSASSVCLALSLKAYLFHKCVFCLWYCFPLDSYAAAYCVPYDAVNGNSDIVDCDFGFRV
jgi:hypothetical protein